MSVEAIEEVKTGNKAGFYIELLQAHLEVIDLKGLKFAKKVSDNIDVLNRELEPINEFMKPSDEWRAFAQRVQQEAQGNREIIAQLESENQELVNARHEQLTLGQEMIEKELDIKLRKFNESELPNEMTARQYMSLKPLIN